MRHLHFNTKKTALLLIVLSTFWTWKIVAAFRGMHVSPAKHSYAWLPRKCDRQMTDKVIPTCRYASQATQKLEHKQNLTNVWNLISFRFYRLWAIGLVSKFIKISFWAIGLVSNFIKISFWAIGLVSNFIKISFWTIVLVSNFIKISFWAILH